MIVFPYILADELHLLIVFLIMASGLNNVCYSLDPMLIQSKAFLIMDSGVDYAYMCSVIIVLDADSLDSLIKTQVNNCPKY